MSENNITLRSNIQMPKAQPIMKVALSAIYECEGVMKDKQTPVIEMTLTDTPHDPMGIVLSSVFQKIDELEKEIKLLKGEESNGKEKS